jgi:hypothetical protein
MKESKFVELLNLYVDQEISPPEAELLEAEIHGNLERRRVYLQYCRMHRASTVLFESFRSEKVPAGSKLVEAARVADEKVVAFPEFTPRRPVRWAYAAGLVAVAACVALVFVRQPAGNQTRPNEGANLAQNAVTPARPAAAQPVAVTPIAFAPAVAPMARREFTPVFVTRSLDAQETTANAVAALDANRAALEWMQRVQLPPVQNLALENLVFELQPTLRPDQRTFRSSRPVQVNVEKAAFQYQR